MSPLTLPPTKRTASEANLDSSSANHLPIRQYASQIAQFLNDNKSSSIIIIVSDTGSGKTTQIPQLLTDKVFDGFFDGAKRSIAVTQPRRVAAVSVATRVAAEFGCKLGTDVGYSVRFDDCTSPTTKIKYMTDGYLVKEAQSDWSLPEYNMVILDEVHERSLHTDLLLAMIKKTIFKRRKRAEKQKDCSLLKVILMSATMDVKRMLIAFKNAPVLFVPGKTFPVEVKFTPNPVEDYTHSTTVAIFQIHRTEPVGDILVFLTGQEEIEDLVRRCRQLVKSLPSALASISFHPLYAALKTEVQMQAISGERYRQNGLACQRKVIISTNLAETSLTIPGVKYVIDCGRVKSKLYAASTGLEVLKVEKISQAQAWQRTGRAGREQAGICYRLYTEEEFNSWQPHPIPEILRSNLSNALLQLTAMNIDKPLEFPFFDRPEEDNIRASLDQLEWLGAITQKEENGEIKTEMTADGVLLAKFPLDPRYSRCILRARAHNCMEEMLTIIAMLSCDSPYAIPLNQRKEASLAHAKFTSNEGDFITYLKLWRAYKESNTSANNKSWISANYLNHRNLQLAEKTRTQLRQICDRWNIPILSCGQNITALRRALCEGLFMNSAEMLPDGSYITLDTKKPVFIHPSSCLFKTKPACIVYQELMQTTKLYMRQLCLVEKEWVDAVGSKYFVDIRTKMAERSSVTVMQNNRITSPNKA